MSRTLAQPPMATPDFNHYPMTPGLIEARLAERWVEVCWSDGARGRFHFTWLRDNVADPQAIDPHSRERVFDFLDLPLSGAPRRVAVTGHGGLRVSWQETGHESVFHPGWLRAHCYDLGAREAGPEELTTWDAGFAARLPTFEWRQVVEDPRARLDWLHAVRRHGISLLTGGPVDRAGFAAWVEGLFVVRDMNWGKYYDVVYEPHGSYIANKGVFIAPHVDGPTREHMPGVQILGCVENSVPGGESAWVDGFHVAARLRREHPRDYDLLTRVTWATANRSPHSEYRWNAPLIVTDPAGRPLEVRDTHWLREPLLVEFDQVEPVYAAYRRYTLMVRDPAQQIRRRLAPGDIAVIDNRRVLHARAAYRHGEGRRHLRLCYSEREELLSRIRVIERELASGGTQ